MKPGQKTQRPVKSEDRDKQAHRDASRNLTFKFCQIWARKATVYIFTAFNSDAILTYIGAAHVSLAVPWVAN